MSLNNHNNKNTYLLYNGFGGVGLVGWAGFGANGADVLEPKSDVLGAVAVEEVADDTWKKNKKRINKMN